MTEKRLSELKQKAEAVLVALDLDRARKLIRLLEEYEDLLQHAKHIADRLRDIEAELASSYFNDYS
ncbi:MAG: hypothetical protein QXZ09_08425 [Candidatus Methanomethylicaceae archaeon]